MWWIWNGMKFVDSWWTAIAKVFGYWWLLSVWFGHGLLGLRAGSRVETFWWWCCRYENEMGWSLIGEGTVCIWRGVWIIVIRKKKLLFYEIKRNVKIFVDTGMSFEYSQYEWVWRWRWSIWKSSSCRVSFAIESLLSSRSSKWGLDSECQMMMIARSVAWFSNEKRYLFCDEVLLLIETSWGLLHVWVQGSGL